MRTGDHDNDFKLVRGDEIDLIWAYGRTFLGATQNHGTENRGVVKLVVGSAITNTLSALGLAAILSIFYL